MADSSSSRPEKASQAFNKRFTDIVMSAYTTLSVSYGLDLGLFDVMARADDMQTAAEIAELASCKERYVKEWLGHMVVSDIVSVDETGTRYLLPVHHKEALTSRQSVVRSFARVLPYLAIPHEDLVNCGRKSGPSGLPYSRVGRFFDELRKDSGEKTGSSILDGVLDAMPEMEQRLSAGISVCEIGSGIGQACLEIARRFPKTEVTGLDIYEPYVAKAEDAAKASGLQNISFCAEDASEMPGAWTNTFDFIFMYSSFHDIPRARKALQEIHRCLKVKGQFLMQEINIRSNLHESLKDPEEKANGQMYFPVSLYHCLPASMCPEVSDALGTCVGKDRVGALLETAGFKVLDVSVMADKSLVKLVAVKPDD